MAIHPEDVEGILDKWRASCRAEQPMIQVPERKGLRRAKVIFRERDVSMRFSRIKKLHLFRKPE